ncbi:MAG TPA: DegT/DnrJ/EryC1/StrS family aminotransferase, partial [Spirochaetia bacterium]|nr:DegT/DnrJ/EryC1/StrS family aminotransferase [Spirochaetia bacterium]
PEQAPYARHVYHLFVVRVPERDRVLKELTKAGIQCGIHYPIPIHLQPAYQGSPFIAFSCETTTRFAGRLLSLPMSAELNRAQTEVVVKELERAQRTARPTGVLLSRQSRQRQVAPPNVER